ncbi:MAG: LuxR C-terminal-related transcriptional regulator [Prosthecobacter sp.]
MKWGGGTLLLSGPCVIGRRSDNDLQINNVQVSRRHALVLNFNEDWWLNDLGSRNGVMVNGLRLTNARRLRNGDEIRIANQRIIFTSQGRSSAPRSSIVGQTTQMAVGDEGDDSAAGACELIIANGAGEILEGVKAANWFFGQALDRHPGAANYLLPVPVIQWLARVAADSDAGSAPLEFHDGDRRVIVTLARRKDDRFFLVVREESLQASIERLRKLGLTRREAEVMQWVSEGKTNPEIARILSISLGTVNHHIEHIFKKFDVDNRQKAIKHMMDRLAV